MPPAPGLARAGPEEKLGPSTLAAPGSAASRGREGSPRVGLGTADGSGSAGPEGRRRAGQCRRSAACPARSSPQPPSCSGRLQPPGSEARLMCRWQLSFLSYKPDVFLAVQGWFRPIFI